MPVGSEILHVACQGGQPCLWALVEVNAKTTKRVFRLFGTGHPIPDQLAEDCVHVATFQQGPYVWHLFEFE